MTGYGAPAPIVMTNIHAPVKFPAGDPMPWQTEDPRP